MSKYIIALLMMCAAAWGQVLMQQSTSTVAGAHVRLAFTNAVGHTLGLTNDYTISATIRKTTPVFSATGYSVLTLVYANNLTGQGTHGINIYTNYSIGVFVRQEAAPHPSQLIVTPANFAPLNETVSMCITRKSMLTSFYKNGELFHSAMQTITNDNAGNYPFHISGYGGGAANIEFGGIIEDFRIYSRAFSAQEASELARYPWMHAEDYSQVLRTCVVTNDTGTALGGIARNLGTGADGTYSNAPTVAPGKIQTSKPLTMELP